MTRILTNLVINEISSVDRGAGEGVKVMLMKRDDPSERDDPTVKHWFDQVDFRKLADEIASVVPTDDPDDPDTETAASAVSDRFERFISIVTEAYPHMDRREVIDFLLNSAAGRKVAEHLRSVTKTRKENQMSRSETLVEFVAKGGSMGAVAKHIIEKGSTAVTEQEFTAMLTEHAKMTKRAGETTSQAFSRIFTDVDNGDIRKAYAITKQAAYPVTI